MNNMDKNTSFTLELDGQEISATAEDTLWQLAKRHGVDIPHLCYKDDNNYREDGNCRACMVEIEGERVLAASCQRTTPINKIFRPADLAAKINQLRIAAIQRLRSIWMRVFNVIYVCVPAVKFR